MTKQEVLEIEKENEEAIVLFLEGTFWIAYERSAFRFANMIRPYKVKKKWIKTVGCEVASMGFPATALDDIITSEGVEIIEQTPTRVTLRATELPDEEKFDVWKESLELSARREPKPGLEPGAVSAEEDDEAVAMKSIYYRVRGMSLENSTPLECVMFVADLKRMLAQ